MTVSPADGTLVVCENKTVDLSSMDNLPSLARKESLVPYLFLQGCTIPHFSSPALLLAMSQGLLCFGCGSHTFFPAPASMLIKTDGTEESECEGFPKSQLIGPCKETAATELQTKKSALLLYISRKKRTACNSSNAGQTLLSWTNQQSLLPISSLFEPRLVVFKSHAGSFDLKQLIKWGKPCDFYS